MSQELIYTSAPQGLRFGSRGFCTVASTSGMAAPLAERLESLSGYRHLFPPGDAQAGLNPIVYSHLFFSQGGQAYHVLSRIADAGFDYSRRSNKLAHHVALAQTETVAAGPAWVLSQPGFSECTWSGEPRILPAGRKPPQGNISLGVCQTWDRITGDAGWAGVLAETAMQTRPSPIYLVFEPGTEVLPLLVEAQSLLPVRRRWAVSFSTYFTGVPQGIDCLWRCVVRDSREALAAQRTPGSMILDLSRGRGQAPDGPLVLAARTGQITHAEPESPAVVAGPTALPTPTPGAAPPAAAPPDTPEPERAPVAGFVMPPPLTSDAEYRLGPPPAPGGARRMPTMFTRRPRPARRKRRWIKAVLVGVIGTLLALAGGATYYYFWIYQAQLKEQKLAAGNNLVHQAKQAIEKAQEKSKEGEKVVTQANAAIEEFKRVLGDAEPKAVALSESRAKLQPIKQNVESVSKDVKKDLEDIKALSPELPDANTAFERSKDVYGQRRTKLETITKDVREAEQRVAAADSIGEDRVDSLNKQLEQDIKTLDELIKAIEEQKTSLESLEPSALAGLQHDDWNQYRQDVKKYWETLAAKRKDICDFQKDNLAELRKNAVHRKPDVTDVDLWVKNVKQPLEELKNQLDEIEGLLKTKEQAWLLAKAKPVPPAESTSLSPTDPLGGLKQNVALPDLKVSEVGDTAADASKDISLGTITGNPTEVRLALLANTLQTTNGYSLTFRFTDRAGKEGVWNVEMESQEKERVASFRLDSRELRFEWDQGLVHSKKGLVQRLEHCVLRVSHGMHVRDITLQRCVRGQPIAYNPDFDSIKAKVSFPLDESFPWTFVVKPTKTKALLLKATVVPKSNNDREWELKDDTCPNLSMLVTFEPIQGHFTARLEYHGKQKHQVAGNSLGPIHKKLEDSKQALENATNKLEKTKNEVRANLKGSLKKDPKEEDINGDPSVVAANNNLGTVRNQFQTVEQNYPGLLAAKPIVDKIKQEKPLIHFQIVRKIDLPGRKPIEIVVYSTLAEDFPAP